MANLFGKARSTITEHISNIFVEGELVEKVVCRNIRLTTHHGAIEGKTQEKALDLYANHIKWIFSCNAFSILRQEYTLVV